MKVNVRPTSPWKFLQLLYFAILHFSWRALFTDHVRLGGLMVQQCYLQLGWWQGGNKRGLVCSFYEELSRSGHDNRTLGSQYSSLTGSRPSPRSTLSRSSSQRKLPSAMGILKFLPRFIRDCTYFLFKNLNYLIIIFNFFINRILIS